MKAAKITRLPNGNPFVEWVDVATAEDVLKIDRENERNGYLPYYTVEVPYDLGTGGTMTIQHMVKK